MPRVLLAGRIHEDGMAILRARPDLEIEEMAETGAPAFLDRLPEADALLIRTAILPEAALARATRLRVVSRHGVGYDNIPLAALTARGIPLALVGNVNAETVAEHTLFLILALAKQALAHDRGVRTGAWETRNNLAATEVTGKSLLILGYGRVGREVARRAAAFGMRLEAYDPVVEAAAIRRDGVAPVTDWRAALAAADVVTLHLPRTPETERMIGRAELAAMKRTAFLINTARGGLIDEAALSEALEAGALAGAGLDTFDVEPPPPNHPLLASDRVVLSPHCAGLTLECAMRMAVRAAENVLAGLDGRLDPDLVVNRSVLGR